MKRFAVSILLICASWYPPAGLAQGGAVEFPTKPVRIVVGFTPGTTTDITARALAQALTARLGQQVIVENREGANSGIANSIVAHANPDGHTLLIGTLSLVVSPLLYKELPFDPHDLAPVSLVVLTQNVICALRPEKAPSDLALRLRGVRNEQLCPARAQELVRRLSDDEGATVLGYGRQIELTRDALVGHFVADRERERDACCPAAADVELGDRAGCVVGLAEIEASCGERSAQLTGRARAELRLQALRANHDPGVTGTSARRRIVAGRRTSRPHEENDGRSESRASSHGLLQRIAICLACSPVG